MWMLWFPCSGSYCPPCPASLCGHPSHPARIALEHFLSYQVEAQHQCPAPLASPTLVSVSLQLWNPSLGWAILLMHPPSPRPLSHCSSDILCGLLSPFSLCLDANILCLATLSFLSPFMLWHPLLGCSLQVDTPFTLLMLHFPYTNPLLILLRLLLLPPQRSLPCSTPSNGFHTELFTEGKGVEGKRRASIFYGNSVIQVYVWQK